MNSSNEFRIIQYLHFLKKNIHSSLLSPLVSRERDNEHKFLTLSIKCCLTSKYILTPIRNTHCELARCVFNLSEELALFILESQFIYCPSCQKVLPKDSFFLCKQTEDIVSKIFTEATHEPTEGVMIDIQECIKSGFKNMDKYITRSQIEPKPSPKKTILEIPEIIPEEDSPSKFPAKILNNSQSLEISSLSFSHREEQETKSNSSILCKSISIDLSASSPKPNKWKERMEKGSISPSSSRMNRWEARKRSHSRSMSPSGRINKWESKRLKDLNLSKLLKPISTCKVNYLGISSRDTFNAYCERKFLCYFQERTKYLHILDLKALFINNDDISLKFTKIELNIEFNIPYSHCSIIDSYGNIYLIGGCDPQKDYKDSKNIFTYDFDEKTLNYKGQLKTPRSGHTCCLIRDNIYVIGGYTGERTLKTCERFNIMTGNSEYIADLNTSVAYACVVPFKGQYIYKFGGCIELGKLDEHIERYDLAQEKWEIIYMSPTIRKNYKPMCLSAGIQIYTKDIYIFGGSYDYLGEKTSQSFIFSVENEGKNIGKISSIDKFPLPIAERFDCNNQVIILDNHLFWFTES